MIVTARVEGLRVYQTPGTLILSEAAPGSARSAEIRLSVGVRAGHELADLSPGKTVGALYLASLPTLLPKGFNQNRPAIDQVSYDPVTRFLERRQRGADPRRVVDRADEQGGRAAQDTNGKLNLDLWHAGPNQRPDRLALHRSERGGPGL